MNFSNFKKSIFHQLISGFIATAFFTTSVVPPAFAQLLPSTVLNLPVPGTLVSVSPTFTPVIIKGITIHPTDPLQMNFIVNSGDEALEEQAFTEESKRLIKYFLASLTIPEEELWVNLSPYEENRIVPDNFGKTQMGRDLLAQDYMLKQLTSSMMYPENDLGKEFWNRVHKLAYEKYGTTEIPMNTFNKIWIVPEKAVIYEHANSAVIVESKLKVLLEEDYLALDTHNAEIKHSQTVDEADIITGASLQVVREVLIPEIEKEINHGKTFTHLRQIYHSVILANWYKENLKESLLGQVYVDQNKTAGIENPDQGVNQKIYEQYVESFKKGVYNYIKEDLDPATNQKIPRHYYSGGGDLTNTPDEAVFAVEDLTPRQQSSLRESGNRRVEIKLDQAIMGDVKSGADIDSTQPQRPDFATDSTSDFAMLGKLKDMFSRLLPPNKKKARPSLFSTDPENVGKFYGRIEADEGFFNVNKAVESAIAEDKVTDTSAELKGLVAEYLEQEGVQEALTDLDFNVNALIGFMEQENIHFKTVEDLKNGSPVLVMRDKDNYQVDHVGRKYENMYMGHGLYQALSQSSSDKHNKLLKVWALRQLVTLYISSKVTASTDDRLRATAQAQDLAEKIEKKLVGDDLDAFIHENVNTFTNQYFEKLKRRNVVFDYEYSLLTEEQGVYLVGGKSYQAAIEWAREPEDYLRTFSGTARASERLLAVGGPALFDEIKQLIEGLDPKNEEQNEHVSQTIQNMILELEIPEDIRRDIVAAYQQSGGRYAVRSSGRAEDKELTKRAQELRNFQTGSNAGQHETGLGVLGDEGIVEWWHIDVASLFSKAVLGYRDTLMVVAALNTFFNEGSAEKIKSYFEEHDDEYGALIIKAIEDPENRIKNISSLKFLEALQRHNETGNFTKEIDTLVEARATFMDLDNIAMGVTFMPMADAPVSYVAFGHDIETGWTGMHFQDIHPDEYKNRMRVATITTTYQLGETIVQGKGTPDTFKVHIFTDKNGKEHINIVYRKLGDKTVQTVYTAPLMEQLGLQNQELAQFYDVLEVGAEVLSNLGDDLEHSIANITEQLNDDLVNADFMESRLLNVNSEADLKTALSILGILVAESVENTNAKIAELNEQQKGLFTFENEDLKNFVHLLKAKLEKPKTQTMFTDVPEHLRGIFSASDSQVKKIAERMIKNADYYGRLLDTEGVIGDNLGVKDKVITVQRRPSTAIGDIDNPTKISINETYVKAAALKAADPEKGEVDVDVNDTAQIRSSIESLFKDRLGSPTKAENALEQLDAFLADRGLPQAGKGQVDTDPENPILVKDLLVEGVPTRNAFSGVIVVVESNKPLIPQLARIYALAETGVQIVLRTRETTPDFMEVLKHENVVAVIADAGGSTSHAAVVSRELNIATIVGIETYAKSLRNRHGERKAQAMLDYINTSGNTITVDANQNDETGNGRAFAGLLPINERDIEMDTNRFPNIFTKIGYIMGTAFPMVKMSKIVQFLGFGGVVLFRGEFLYAEENINPRMGRGYDSMLIHDTLRFIEIKETKGDSAADEFMQTLHPDEQAAINKFMSHLDNREERRSKGTPIVLNQAEEDINYYKDNGGSEAFWNSLDDYRRKDIEGLRADALATQKEREEDSESERQSAIQLITSQLLGAVWYDEFFNRVHGEAISLMAGANKLTDEQWVTYRIIDFKGNESRNLIGGNIVNPEPESSTMVGERGGRWLLQPENQVIYREELRMLLRQIDKGYTNVAVMLPFVSTPEELEQLLEIMEQEEHNISRELKRSVHFRKVKMMVELPSNIIQAKQFVKVLRDSEAKQKTWHKQNYGVDITRKSGLSFGTNDLTQTSEWVDRENPIWKKFFDEGHESVIDSLKYVASLSAELEIECEICGQALANVPDDVAEEIMIILGMTGGAIGTDYLGTQRAINISGRATMKNSIMSRKLGASDVIADNFVSNLNRGAATRAMVKVKTEAELNKLTKASIGDFVVITDNKISLDLADDTTKANVTKLGAVLYTNGFSEELKAGIEALGVPTIRVRDTAAATLAKRRNETYITVDFNNQKIYKGKKRRIDTRVNVEAIDLTTSIKVYEEDEDREVSSKDFDYSVKANDVYVSNNIHPLALLAYDNTDADSSTTRRQDLEDGTVEHIESLLAQYEVADAKSLIKAMVAQQVNKQSESDEMRIASPAFVYESLTLRSDVADTLIGHEAAVVSEEPNPALGLFGMDTKSEKVAPHALYRELFSLEMQAVKSLAESNLDISIELSYFRKYSTLQTAIEILDSIGLDSKLVPRGFRANTVNSYLYTTRFIEEGDFTFVTVDQEELLEAYIAADVKKNDNVRNFYSFNNWARVRKSLGYPERMIRVSAYENDVPIRMIPLADVAMVAQALPAPEAFIDLLEGALTSEGNGQFVRYGNKVEFWLDQDYIQTHRAEFIAGIRAIRAALLQERGDRLEDGRIQSSKIGALQNFQINKRGAYILTAIGKLLGIWKVYPNDRIDDEDTIRYQYESDPSGINFPQIVDVNANEIGFDAAMLSQDYVVNIPQGFAQLASELIILWTRESQLEYSISRGDEFLVVDNNAKALEDFLTRNQGQRVFFEIDGADVNREDVDALILSLMVRTAALFEQDVRHRLSKDHSLNRTSLDGGVPARVIENPASVVDELIQLSQNSAGKLLIDWFEGVDEVAPDVRADMIMALSQPDRYYDVFNVDSDDPLISYRLLNNALAIVSGEEVYGAETNTKQQIIALTEQLVDVRGRLTKLEELKRDIDPELGNRASLLIQQKNLEDDITRLERQFEEELYQDQVRADAAMTAEAVQGIVKALRNLDSTEADRIYRLAQGTLERLDLDTVPNTPNNRSLAKLTQGVDGLPALLGQDGRLLPNVGVVARAVMIDSKGTIMAEGAINIDAIIATDAAMLVQDYVVQVADESVNLAAELIIKNKLAYELGLILSTPEQEYVVRNDSESLSKFLRENNGKRINFIIDSPKEDSTSQDDLMLSLWNEVLRVLQNDPVENNEQFFATVPGATSYESVVYAKLRPRTFSNPDELIDRLVALNEVSEELRLRILHPNGHMGIGLSMRIPMQEVLALGQPLEFSVAGIRTFEQMTRLLNDALEFVTNAPTVDQAMLALDYVIQTPDNMVDLASEVIIKWALQTGLTVTLSAEKDLVVENNPTALAQFIRDNQGDRITFSVEGQEEYSAVQDSRMRDLGQVISKLFDKDASNDMRIVRTGMLGKYNWLADGYYIDAGKFMDPEAVVDALIELAEASGETVLTDDINMENIEVNVRTKAAIIEAITNEDDQTVPIYVTGQDQLAAYRLLNNALSILATAEKVDESRVVHRTVGQQMTVLNYQPNDLLINEMEGLTVSLRRRGINVDGSMDPEQEVPVFINAEDPDALKVWYRTDATVELFAYELLANGIGESVDQAMTGEVDSTKGGIDLDPNLFEIETKGDGTLTFPKVKGSMPQLNIDGLVPVIINVTPINSLPLILGLADTAEDESSDLSYDSLDPTDRKNRSEMDKLDQLSLLVN